MIASGIFNIWQDSKVTQDMGWNQRRLFFEGNDDPGDLTRYYAVPFLCLKMETSHPYDLYNLCYQRLRILIFVATENNPEGF